MMRKFSAALLLLGAVAFGNAAMADNTEWANPEPVTIYGYSGPSQDAFIAPASPIMLFDSHTDDATIPSNIFQAYQFDYRTFLNLGMVQGLDYGIKGNPNIDATGNFVWWTNAFYPQILATAIQGKFVNGVVSAVAPVMGISRGWVYWVTMSPEISADGNTLLYGDFNTDSEGVPLRSVLTIATKNGDGSFSKTPGSDGMLAAVNAAVPIVYNGRMSSDGLELYFTGVVYVPSGPQVYVAKRASVTVPFDAPQLIAVAGQKAENGSLSRDGKHLYHHKMLGPLNAQSQSMSCRGRREMAMKSIKKLYGSPAIVSVSRGAGEFAGAGELPPRGPGVAAKRKISAVVPAPKSGGRRGGRSK